MGVLIFALSFAIFIYTDGWIVPFCFATLTVLCCVYGAVRFLRIRTAVIFALIPLFAFAYFTLYTYFFVPSRSQGFSSAVTGVVENSSTYFSNQSIDIKTVHSDTGIAKGTRIRVYTGLEESCKPGDTINIKGIFHPASDKPKLLSSGIKYYTYGETSYITHNEGFFTKIRNKISSNCDKAFPPEIAAFVKAITIGDTSFVSLSDYAAYSAAGVSHVLAVSGFHLSILVMSLYSLLKKITSNRIILSLAGIAFSFFVAGFTGFSYSALRSAIMLSVFLAGKGVKRNSDSVTSLFISLLVLILANPYSVCSLSLQLSFLSTLGIITVGAVKLIKAERKSFINKCLSDYLLNPFLFSLSAFGFTLPVLVFSTDKISLISPVANILAGLMFPFILILSYLFGGFSLISGYLAFPFAFLVKYLVKCFIYVCRFFSKLPLAFIPASSPYLIIPVAVCLVCIILLLLARKKRLIIIIPLSLVLVMISTGISVFAQIKDNKSRSGIAYMDTRESFAVYVSDKERGIFIDNGGEFLCEDLVFTSGNVKCNSLVLSEYDEFTFKKAEYFISCLQTEEIYIKKPGNDEESACLSEITLLANAEGCDIIEYDVFYGNTGNVTVYMNNSVVINLSGYKAVIPLVSDSEIFGTDFFDFVFLPERVYGKKFDYLPRTGHLIYGSHTEIKFFNNFPDKTGYTAFDPVTVTITKKGGYKIKQWR